jgi:GAF domain-containing protein
VWLSGTADRARPAQDRVLTTEEDARESLAQLADEQAALRRVATLVARGSSPAEIFGAVTEEACRVLASEAVGLLRFEPDKTATLVAQSDTPWPPPPLGTRFTLDGENLVTEVFRTGQVARADDWAKSTGAVAAMASALGVRSAVAFPVVVEGRLWGTSIAATSQEEPLPKATESRLGQFTGLVATAIANAQARAELSQLAEEQVALRRVATLVAQQPLPEEIFAAVAEAVGSVLGADVATIAVFPDDVAAKVVGTWGRDELFVPIGLSVPLDEDSVMARVFHSTAPARVEAYAQGAAAEIVRTLGIRSSVGAPVLVEGKLWGMLGAAMRGDHPLPEDAEVRLAAFTELVATAVSNAQAHEDLQRLADEQAALRRIATLVAGGAEPEQVFAAVTEEAAATFDAIAVVMRFEHDPPGVTVIGLSREIGVPIGTRSPLLEGMTAGEVYRTGRSARISGFDWASRTGLVAEAGRRIGVSSQVSSPILVEGRLWGVISLIATEELPADSEQRLEKFAELVTTAIANAEAGIAVRTAADEQGALRRVATLVAASSSPSDVFVAVTNEIALVLGADAAMLCRADPDGAAVVVGTWADGTPEPAHGTRIPPGGRNLTTIVLETGRAARIDSYGDGEATGYASEFARTYGLRSAVGAPIHVEGRLWGLVVAGTTRDEPLPPDAEERLAAFTELTATAISNAQAHEDLASLAEQQAALRRVATLVARRVPSEVVFQAVAEEAGGLLGAEVSGLVRLESDDTVTVMAGPSPGPYAAGERVAIEPGFVVHSVRETGRAARFETDDPAAEGMPELVRRLGFRSAVASPIVVEGGIWGAVVLGSSGASFPPETEQRLDEFTELVATAISNAAARADLVASRARIVFAGDEARRRIERNLHDGTQQRLIALGLDLQSVRAAISEDQHDTHSALVGVEEDLDAILADLRELSHGLHPPLLSRLGLGPSLRALARRSPIPVELDVDLPERPAPSLETAVYYVVSEALANAIKHSRASEVTVTITSGETLEASIADDGVGDADPTGGSGLTGLLDRVEALGGRFALDSPPRGGTTISIELPVEPAVAD